MVRRRSAFSLIELLVVISIIGILIAIGVISWVAVAARGRDTTRKSDLARLKQVLQQQYGDTRTYPAFETNNAGEIYSASWQLTSSGLACAHTDTIRLTTKYIDQIPTDPRDSTKYTTATCANLGTGQAGRYLYLSAPTKSDTGPNTPATGFGLMATLEQNQPDWVTPANNPLNANYSGSTFGDWYKQFANYTTLGVDANFLLTNQGQ